MNYKILLTWLGLCTVTAAVTVAGVKALDPVLDLQHRVASFGKKGL